MENFKNYQYYKEFVEDHLVDFLPSVDEKSRTLADAMKYSLLSGGKRLRPILFLAACEFAGGNINQGIPYAVALEYIHTYSLIHDDLPSMDNDDTRRGVATNHKIFGEAEAILAGDGLLNSAFEAMFRDMYLSFDKEDILKRKIRAASAIAASAGCKGMIAGQFSDIESENKICSKEMLEYIHINKTGALIEGALCAGGYLGGADKNMIKDLTAYGCNLGFAFQIADDIMDVEGNPDIIGKATKADEKKCTYPKMYGLDAAKKRVEELHEEAINILGGYGEKSQFFIELISYLSNRKK